MAASTAAVRHVIGQRGHEPQLFLLRGVFVDEFAIMHPENGPCCALRAFTKASHNRRECGQDVAPACKPPHATSATVVLARPSEPSRLRYDPRDSHVKKMVYFLSERTTRTTHMHTCTGTQHWRSASTLQKFNDNVTIRHYTVAPGTDLHGLTVHIGHSHLRHQYSTHFWSHVHHDTT